MSHVDVTLADIREARERIHGIVRPMRLLPKETLSAYAHGARVELVCEHLQRTGSFKIRGATNLIAQLTDDERARGVVAASAGNHAQGVAVAASMFDVDATIFMPLDASLSKIEATRGYGASVQLAGDSLTQTLDAAHAYATDQGAIFIHPFDDARIVAGQGTLGLDIIDAMPDVDTILIPVGGGGLAAGVARVIKELRPTCRVVAVQSAACASLDAAIHAGEPTLVDSRPSMADGILVKQTGALPFAMLRDLVDDVVLVDEDEISTAMLWALERSKQLLEGAGATALAALLSGRAAVTGPTAVVLGGGNIDPAGIIPVIRHGLSAVGRYVYIGTILPDRPGELSRLLAILAEQRVNVLGVEHHREGVATRIGETRVDLVLQTRDAAHVVDVRAALEAGGYPLVGS
jgi:threonine dehydratase